LVDICQTWPLIYMKLSTNFTDLITHGSSCKQLIQEIRYISRYDVSILFVIFSGTVFIKWHQKCSMCRGIFSLLCAITPSVTSFSAETSWRENYRFPGSACQTSVRIICISLQHRMYKPCTQKLTFIFFLFQWLYSPCGPWPLFRFPDLFTGARTPWTSDQLDTQHKPRKTHIHH
jgi:hypothetical protein